MPKNDGSASEQELGVEASSGRTPNPGRGPGPTCRAVHGVQVGAGLALGLEQTGGDEVIQKHVAFLGVGLRGVGWATTSVSCARVIVSRMYRSAVERSTQILELTRFRRFYLRRTNLMG
jgi:hypothetical protein